MSRFVRSKLPATGEKIDEFRRIVQARLDEATSLYITSQVLGERTALDLQPFIDDALTDIIVAFTGSAAITKP